MSVNTYYGELRHQASDRTQRVACSTHYIIVYLCVVTYNYISLSCFLCTIGQAVVLGPPMCKTPSRPYFIIAAQARQWLQDNLFF